MAKPRSRRGFLSDTARGPQPVQTRDVVPVFASRVPAESPAQMNTTCFRIALATSFGLLCSALCFAQTGAPPPTPGPTPTACHDFGDLHAIANQMVAAVPRRGSFNQPIDGASLRVARNGEQLYLESFGNYDRTTVLPIASATKWLSAAVILTLVDDGSLDLDEPVSTYLPEFTGAKGAMTVRQMFSHTSGLPGNHPIISANAITLAQAVRFVANQVPLQASPGAEFDYGGVSMHVAGRVAEVVGGQDWAQLFQSRIASPLGMTGTDYLGLGSATNPRIAGGARSSVEDYSRFLEMLGGRGLFRGQRVLSTTAIDTMLRDQTAGATIVGIPSGAPRLGYGLGCWVEAVDPLGRATSLSSPGAFGCTPWIDLERGTEAVLVIESQNSAVDPFADQMRNELQRVIRFRGATCFGNSSPSCLGPLRLTTNRLPRAGDPAFVLRGSQLPPNALGTLLVGLPASGPPVPILGVQIYVPVDPNTISVPLQGGAGGAIEVPAPLDAVGPGSRFSLQVVFGPAPGCGGAAPLSSSHALGLDL